MIELGPGTGVFTRALLERGVKPENLALIELSTAFARRLEADFPGVAVHNRSAADLKEMDLFGGAPVGAVVSGLGLLAMPDDLVLAILDGVFRHLKPGGAVIQFSYSPRSPVRTGVLDKSGYGVERVGRTYRNLPPAFVYKITQG